MSSGNPVRFGRHTHDLLRPTPFARRRTPDGGAACCLGIYVKPLEWKRRKCGALGMMEDVEYLEAVRSAHGRVMQAGSTQTPPSATHSLHSFRIQDVCLSDCSYPYEEHTAARMCLCM